MSPPRVALPLLHEILKDERFTDETRERVRNIAGNQKVQLVLEEIMSCYKSEAAKKQIREAIEEMIIDLFEVTAENAAVVIEKCFAPLWHDGGPGEDENFGKVTTAANGDCPLRPVLRQAKQGDLLETYRGCSIRALYEGWQAEDGGVYVGRGSSEVPRSIFHETYGDGIATQEASEALDGRPLYVLRGETDAAKEVVDRFEIKGKVGINTEIDCMNILQAFAVDRVSVSLLGVVLKELFKHRPGHLGNMIRLLPCCARKHFRQTPVELLPIRLPETSEDEKKLKKAMREFMAASREVRLELRPHLENLSKSVGVDCWVWIMVAITNYLFCGGSRPLGKVMAHPWTHTPEQSEVLKHYRRLALLWAEIECDPITCAGWEQQAQDLGDLYTGKEVRKAYKLTWKAIEPHVPKEGEAGRIPLEKTVDPQLVDFVRDPELLRIPDDELTEVRHSAPVLVESNQEYDLIVSHLVQPIYNGLFGVHKSWIAEENGSWSRTLRLIVNLIPSNACQKRMPLQPSKSMGYAPLWGSMVLLEDELIMAYGEDIKHCFHIFSPDPKWRGYFVLSKKASGAAFADGQRETSRPRVKSAPMGWSNIVDFVQSSLERMGQMSGINSTRVVQMGQPSPTLPLGVTRDYHSFYVDNYDGFTVIASTDQGLYEGKPSESQLRLRATFKCWGVERDEKKAAEGTLAWTSLGAEQLGDEGLVGSSRKFRRAVAGAVVTLLKRVDNVRSSELELASVVGKLMHSTQYCRPLACCFDEVYRCINGITGNGGLTGEAIDELYLLLGRLPLHWIDQRMKLSPTVFATDASQEGGGACCSTLLSARGKAKCRLLCTEVDDKEGGQVDDLLLVEAFGGIGGLRKALELLGVLPQGIILIDSDPVCLKLAKRHCAYVVAIDNIKKVTKEMVSGWRTQFPRARRVLIGGGWPCVNHSSLNKARKGAAADSSLLLDDMLQVAAWLKEVSAPLRLSDWKVQEFYENVVMDEVDLHTQSSKIGCLPIMNEASDVLWCRRPRLYWVKNIEVIEANDMKLLKSQQVGALRQPLTVAKIECDKPPLEWFLRDNCIKLQQKHEPFFCFARPQPRSEPPPDPAGYDRCSPKTLGRWRGDSFRLAPYQYGEGNLVKTANGVRRLLSDEQLRMLGFNSDHLDLKQKLTEDQRGQLLGNTFPVVVVARLLVGLALTKEDAHARNISSEIWEVWKTLEDRVSQIKSASWSTRFGASAGSAPGWLHIRKRIVEVASVDPRGAIDPNGSLTDEQLLVYLITRNVSHRGTDCNLDSGMPYSASDFCRRSVDPTLWEWKVLLSYKWKQEAHINQLEAVAILDLLRKQARQKNNRNLKSLLLVDNSTVVGILTKGRTTSRMLRQPLRRITAVLLATSSRFVVAWVKSEWNPADGPSRWVQRRALRDA